MDLLAEGDFYKVIARKRTLLKLCKQDTHEQRCQHVRERDLAFQTIRR